jgi:hypothetical protein
MLNSQGAQNIAYLVLLTTVERAIALILHGIETIQNPYAVLFKGLVQARVLLQLVSGSGKGQNP